MDIQPSSHLSFMQTHTHTDINTCVFPIYPFVKKTGKNRSVLMSVLTIQLLLQILTCSYLPHNKQASHFHPSECSKHRESHSQPPSRPSLFGGQWGSCQKEQQYMGREKKALHFQSCCLMRRYIRICFGRISSAIFIHSSTERLIDFIYYAITIQN